MHCTKSTPSVHEKVHVQAACENAQVKLVQTVAILLFNLLFGNKLDFRLEGENKALIFTLVFSFRQFLCYSSCESAHT